MHDAMPITKAVYGPRRAAGGPRKPGRSHGTPVRLLLAEGLVVALNALSRRPRRKR